jgi:DNA-binding MarR family transcriptional regulator
VDRLVDKGMVERTYDVKDRRVRRVSPSQEGQEVIAAVGSIFGSLLSKIISLLDVSDLELVKQSTIVVLAALSKMSQEAEGGEPV